MADKLTKQQAQAVYDRGGKLLVSAAAGSGKTKVLVDRLLSYVTDPQDPANLDEFLIITYTKAAASELRGKIAAKLTQRIAEEPENRHLQKQMQRLFLTKISTVHGFCGDLLREYAYKLDIPADFRVADENECREIRETVLSDLLDQAYETNVEDADFRAFVDTQGLGRTDKLVSEIILKVYDSARCHMNPNGWLDQCLDAVSAENVEDAGKTMWGDYLIADLHAYLDAQIGILSKCVQRAEAFSGMEKPAANLRDTLFQLEALRDCTTWDEICHKTKIDYGRLTFPRKNPNPELSEQIKGARNACKKGLEKKLTSFADPSSQIISDLQQIAASAMGLVTLVRQFETTYSRAKQSRRVLDFGDLEHLALDLLLGKSRSAVTATAAEIGKRFREIMVDEYQDSNQVQDAIFHALTQEKQNCFMVGDVKQSIYQFRLADPDIFLEKYASYPPVEEAEPGRGRKVMLSHNFRSGPEVIDAVNDVFRCCMRPKVGGLYYGEAEALREGIPHEPFPDPAVELYGLEVREDSYGEEASFVAEQIRQMLEQRVPVRKDGTFRPVEPEDIVILLRSPGSIGSHFQRALEARGIRCTSGGGTNLLQTEEIGTLRSFLQVIVNPRQDIPLVAALASPVFGFSADDLAEFRSKNKKGTLYDALLKSEQPKAKSFLDILKVLRQQARLLSLTKLMELCFTMTHLDSIYGAMSDGEARKNNLQTFYQIAVDFEKGSLRDLGQFLDHLDALEEKGLIHTGNAASGCVTIMSIHKSKGLEFPVVFLCGLGRVFNRESLQAQILCDKELGLGMSVADTVNRIRYPSIAKRAIAAKMASESLSEELRVLYVAMTRARDRLVMTYAARNLQSDLQDIALRCDFDEGAMLCANAVCPGDWILLAAMQKTEAGAFHALGGKPSCTILSSHPWKICVTQAPEDTMLKERKTEKEEQHNDRYRSLLQEALSFRYGHLAATHAPSKQTATALKGRNKDAEVMEDTQEPTNIVRSWRKPSFHTHGREGKVYGSAIHRAMQYIRYQNCGDIEAVRAEIQRLVELAYLTVEQGGMVNCEKIAKFFSTSIGQKLLHGADHIREFKFSILDDASHYGTDLEGEKVLLQGVVDCALLETDGITVIDFKTDYVTEENVDALIDRYRLQLDSYAGALHRIYESPIKAKYLYLFHLDRFVEV